MSGTSRSRDVTGRDDGNDDDDQEVSSVYDFDFFCLN